MKKLNNSLQNPNDFETKLTKTLNISRTTQQNSEVFYANVELFKIRDYIDLNLTLFSKP